MNPEVEIPEQLIFPRKFSKHNLKRRYIIAQPKHTSSRMQFSRGSNVPARSQVKSLARETILAFASYSDAFFALLYLRSFATRDYSPENSARIFPRAKRGDISRRVPRKLPLPRRLVGVSASLKTTRFQGIEAPRDRGFDGRGTRYKSFSEILCETARLSRRCYICRGSIRVSFRSEFSEFSKTILIFSYSNFVFYFWIVWQEKLSGFVSFVFGRAVHVAVRVLLCFATISAKQLLVLCFATTLPTLIEIRRSSIVSRFESKNTCKAVSISPNRELNHLESELNIRTAKLQCTVCESSPN